MVLLALSTETEKRGQWQDFEQNQQKQVFGSPPWHSVFVWKWKAVWEVMNER
jgi:hypothetical protein